MNSKKNQPWGLQIKPHQPTLKQLAPASRNWLLDQSSLTAKLKQRCTVFKVEVLFEGYSEISDEETSLLASAGPYWVREVLLHCDAQAWVFARSILPQKSVLNGAAQVASLDDKPLGELLFKHPQVERQNLAPFTLYSNSKVNQVFTTQQTLWGRSSRFLLQGDPLIVSEVFLPTAILYR